VVREGFYSLPARIAGAISRAAKEMFALKTAKDSKDFSAVRDMQHL
jgi:hypothetical protein